MKSETLQLANMGLEDFKASFNRMQQDPQDGQRVPVGQATVTELFEGVRTITYQIREKQNRQLIATVDVKRIHLEGAPLHPDRLNGLRVRIGWTEPALSFAGRVLLWLNRHFDVELPTWLEVKDAAEKEASKVEEPKGESPLGKEQMKNAPDQWPRVPMSARPGERWHTTAYHE